MARSFGEERSLAQAFQDLVVRSVSAGIGKRQSISSIEGQITDVKTAFSSWDNCMQASFCKWPVIAVIIVGGLIIFSVVWCIARCLCCGVSCCCECCYCLKCCGNCCGCCDAPNKRHKYLDEPYVPPHQDQGYRSQAPMNAAPAPMVSGALAKPEPPQYAEFESGKKGHEDELPQMPSWEGAGSKKVLVEDEPVEMDDLKKPESAQNLPPMAPGAASHPASPNPMSSFGGNSPYGAPSSQAASSGYMTANSAMDPYAMNTPGQGYNNGGFSQASRENLNQAYGNQGYGNQGYGTPGYGVAAAGAGAVAGAGAMGAMGAMNQGRGTPQQDYNNAGYRGLTDLPQTQTPAPYDNYGRSGTPRSRTPGMPANGGYSNDQYGQNRPPRNRTPGMPANDGYTNDQYGQSGPPRSRTPGMPANDGYTNDQYGQSGPPRSRTPGMSANAGYGNDPYGQSGAPRSRTPGTPANGGYGRALPRRAATQDAYGNPDRMRSPAPQQGGYGYEQRSQTFDSYGQQQQQQQQQYRGAPQRQYSSESTQPLARQAPDRQYSDSQYSDAQPAPSHSPLQNVGGFDFNSGFSRSENASPAPQQSANGATAYPGYRAYKPAQ
ncbi:uncharacterized protein BCR38DRAFT_456621 [Pseudomassariella vexata]|uniref:Fibroin-3 related protein n=1 Tax=Pseudomassariella vexata TaxID=1141098 RepID=A0A1Y2E322_9PEZI|nr:uncharacterized protein BCR38DRAFT_456621 [Pseudomassariella vexata]ORY65948.1 hypothetical protein BCR38DRAFT_456621 [Pseudomassariella vexata]